MAQQVVSRTTYFVVFLLLLALLVLTVYASRIEHGLLNVIVAMSIATLKAVLIISVFMHVWYSSGLVRLFAAVGFIWLAILIGMMMNDYVTRGWAASFTS